MSERSPPAVAPIPQRRHGRLHRNGDADGPGQRGPASSPRPRARSHRHGVPKPWAGRLGALASPTMLFAPTVTEVCGDTPDILCRWIFDLTGSEVAADLAIVASKLIRIILILAVAWVVNRAVRHGIDRTVKGWLAARDREREQALAAPPPEGPLASLKALAVALSEFGVDLGPLIASAGIVGVAIGFGAQSLVRDFLSGIFMLVEDQFGVGDIIDVGDTAGVVEEVKLRTTKIRDVNGTLWHIPNGEIRRVANKSQEWARAVLDIEVSYDTDLGHASEVIKRVADEVWEEQIPEATILEEPEIWGVEALGASGISIRLVVKVDPSEQWATARILRRRIKDAFDAEGIEIPFPQRVVWLRRLDTEGPDPAQT